MFLLNDPHIEYDEDYLYSEQVITQDDALSHFRAQERLASISRHVPPRPEHSFLDVGIGEGLLLYLAEQMGYRTYGLDVNAAGVDIARQRYGLKATTTLDPLETAFSNQQFDVIHMNEVIEHITAPKPLLRWCRGHLRAHGCLVVQTGNIDSLASRIKGDDWNYFRPTHVSYFSTRTLLSALHDAGFKIAHYTTVDWRLLRTVLMAGSLIRQGQVHVALNLLLLYVTAQPHGIRRNIVVYAK